MFDMQFVLDTYFSKRKSAKHKYETTGIKTIRMEVLDLQGNVASGYTQVLIVNNTPPVAHFNVEPKSGTSGTIFKVNTGHSEDSQYMKYKLEYRFDWNSDGKFDTHFERKTSWNHRYSTPGVKNIIMEVRDPEGASDTYKKQVEVIPNTPPTASLNIETISVNEKLARIKLDASESKDTQDSKIKYKWDYNYTGENDIMWNTGWLSYPKNYVNFYRSGEYMIRLLVRDKDGAKDTVFVKILIDLAAGIVEKKAN